MPKEYQSATKIEKCSEVFCMILPSDNEAAEVVEPGEKPLNLPTSFVSAEGSPVLRFSDPVATIGRDHFNSVMLIERLIERIAVVGLVADEPVRVARYPEAIESVFDQSHFSRRSAFCPSGDRKTITGDDNHDLGFLSPTWSPPFCLNESPVVEALFHVELAAVSKRLGKLDQQIFEESLLPPILKSSMDRLVVPVAFRQIHPLGSNVQNPEDPVENVQPIGPGALPFVGSNRVFREDGADDFPSIHYRDLDQVSVDNQTKFNL